MKNLFTFLACFITTVSNADTLKSLQKCSSVKNKKEIIIADPLKPRNQIDLKVGYSCKTETKPTRNYKSKGEVKWTLLAKRGGDKQIWAVDTPWWGKIVVSYIEQGLHSHADGFKICNKIEKFKIGKETKEVLMQLPAIGFRYAKADKPLNFELLFYLNYLAVSPASSFYKFWSNTNGYMHHMRLLTSLDGGNSSTVTGYEASIRCVGRL